MENTKLEQLEELARPMMKWLAENYHPHTPLGLEYVQKFWRPLT